MAEKSSNFTVVGGGGLLGWYTRSMSRDLGLVLVRQVVDINASHSRLQNVSHGRGS